MSDLISRQAAIDAIRNIKAITGTHDDEILLIDKAQAQTELMMLPSAEPQNKGKWIGKEQYANSPEYYSWQCSVCGSVLEDPTLDKPYPFCPNCGADMRGEEE